ncbi:MAG: radical SAM protein [Elusimicrobiota bacterium]|nr:radical SAM protein [Elusimicrobiota bacterium]
MSQIFGPVPSRRLGFSLGIDIIPFKTCTLNCIYCQLGNTTNQNVRRKEYISTEQILDELKVILNKKQRIDYITFSGSGEPTLNSKIRQMIKEIKKLTYIPVAVLTNSTLFYREEVRRDLIEADLVLPSLDAVSEMNFKKINRPHYTLKAEKLITGLIKFRQEYKKPIWLEIMLVKGINDGEDELKQMSEAIREIKPDKIQLNTVIRPAAEDFALPVDYKKLVKIKEIFGKNCQIISDFKYESCKKITGRVKGSIFEMLRRRPLTVKDISSSLGLNQNEIIKYLEILIKEGKIIKERNYFKWNPYL